MVSKEYFSWENFNEVADIDAHVNFCTQLIDKYGWKGEKHQEFSSLLNLIRRKQDDKMLNISVVGEFSSGKSTFINALLRMDLLASCVLQGTTVAITVLEYEEGYSITTIDAKGKEISIPFGNLVSLRIALEDLTTRPREGAQLHSVRVGLPSPTLKRGFRIIDTPGTNSLELWHMDVTRRAISELSDLSLVVVAAEVPMPATLETFVQDNLHDVIDGCAFVLTKIDTIPPRERAPLLAGLRKKVANSFSIEKPMVIPYASLDVLAGMGRPAAEQSPLMAQSLEGEKELLSRCARHRAQGQARKLSLLIQNMYTQLSTSLKEVKKPLEEQLTLLERSRQTDLAPFVMEKKMLRQEAFRAHAEQILSQASKELAGQPLNARTQVLWGLDECGTIDDIATFVKVKLPGECRMKAESMIEKWDAYYKKVDSAYKAQIKLFQKAFRQEFTKLKILSVELQPKKETLPVKAGISLGNISQAVSFVETELSKENTTFWGTVAATTAAGTAIAPGVGSVIGFFAGLFAGAHLNERAGRTADNVRPIVSDKLKPPLYNYFYKAQADARQALQKYINSAEKALGGEIDRYHQSYKATVEKRIEKCEKEKKKIEGHINDIEADVNAIASRRKLLESVISNLTKK